MDSHMLSLAAFALIGVAGLLSLAHGLTILVRHSLKQALR